MYNNMDRVGIAFNKMQADAGMTSQIARPSGVNGCEYAIAPYGWGSALPKGWGCIDAINILKSARDETLDGIDMAGRNAYLDPDSPECYCGNVLCTDRGICFAENAEGAAMIPGVAFTEAEDGVVEAATTAIVLTQNSGFQCVGLDSKKGEICAEVPMATPVIVGTYKEPTAIIVPFSNREALENGRKFIDAMIQGYKDDEDTIQDFAEIKGIGKIPKADIAFATPVAVMMPNKPY